MKPFKLVVGIFACTNILFAQSAGDPPSDMGDSAQMRSKADTMAGSMESKMESKKESKKAAVKEHVMTIRGKLVSVNSMDNTIMVKTKKGEETISVESDAKIMKGKKEIAVGDLKEGSELTIHAKMMEGKITASKISVK